MKGRTPDPMNVEELFERLDGKERVGIGKRADGQYTYFHQWFCDGSGDWSAPGPDCGVYDSKLTAKTEAFQRVEWLRATFH